MISFRGRGILLDVEGTTSSISFVYDVLFKFVRRELRGFLERAYGKREFAGVFELIAQDAGHATLAAWVAERGGAPAVELVEKAVIEMMDADRKCRGLKELQGCIWKQGYESGELRSHVFADVPEALRRWQAGGVETRIYSSGSVAAQKLFFAHTEYGDLTPLLRGNYDTAVGPKQCSGSYETIAADIGVAPGALLFVSDVAAELEAARAAGMQTALAVRPGNRPCECDFERVTDFSQIEIA